MRSSKRKHLIVRARVCRTVAAAMFLFTIAASCTSQPQRRDLPDVDVGVPADPTTAATSAGPSPTVASDVAGLTGRLAVLDADGHLGVRLHGEYVSPMLLFGGIPRAVLLPLG